MIISCSKINDHAVKPSSITAKKARLLNLRLVITDNAKKVWSLMQSKKSKAKLLGIVYHNSTKYLFSVSVVNAFSDYFKSVYISSNVNYNSNIVDDSSPIRLKKNMTFASKLTKSKSDSY